jgi:hypothetical protein
MWVVSSPARLAPAPTLRATLNAQRCHCECDPLAYVVSEGGGLGGTADRVPKRRGLEGLLPLLPLLSLQRAPCRILLSLWAALPYLSTRAPPFADTHHTSHEKRLETLFTNTHTHTHARAQATHTPTTHPKMALLMSQKAGVALGAKVAATRRAVVPRATSEATRSQVVECESRAEGRKARRERARARNRTQGNPRATDLRRPAHLSPPPPSLLPNPSLPRDLPPPQPPNPPPQTSSRCPASPRPSTTPSKSSDRPVR